MVRGVLLDLAGVVYEGDHVLPGAIEAVHEIHSAGLPIRFVTNTTTKTQKALLTRPKQLALGSRRTRHRRFCWSIRTWRRNSLTFQTGQSVR
jgi:ribonucleotide monophosphatase NagD (HAD superfamily)